MQHSTAVTLNARNCAARVACAVRVCVCSAVTVPVKSGCFLMSTDRLIFVIKTQCFSSCGYQIFR